MQRKPGFPVANCSIKMPDNLPAPDAVDEDEPLKKRQQLINFGHSQWGFNNWNWAVTKQDLDFVDLSNGKYTAGVVAFVSITVKSLDLHRENIGYATSIAPQKGSAIHNARKCAVTNALRETLLSFGGSVTTELMELLEIHKPPEHVPIEPELPKHSEPKNSPKLNIRKEADIRPHTTVPPAIKNAPNPPPVAKAHPMPVNLPPANRPPIVANAPRAPPPPPGPQVRPNSNVSFVLQPVMPPLYGTPRLAGPPVPPPMYPNYYEYPWHFTYEPFDRHHGNVNLNFNIPPKNLVVNSRSGLECKNACVRPAGPEEHMQYPPPQNQGCWIKPTIFYDGFWTEQKVKKWVAEQVEKQFPEDTSKSSSPSAAQPDSTTPKS
ncbi:DNA repair and recombination protein RAD52-like isoform X1 [Aricia agestis]|uniref:DNA repair and recombination protein RAD52-like isoform X1 n=1 Tax=Aricia agestis TaxID=91739 RepID=UPI001C2053F2|nr:DNA repair and recombination protein RAD52-like isoform X1 [Aricia agestis]